MSEQQISAADPFQRKRISVLDSEMAYVDVGEGEPVIFLHGNPTSSYLWRNVIGHVNSARCLVPDLIGMGDSGSNPAGSYRFRDHARYLDAWIDAVGIDAPITFVAHDWGGALAFHWGCRHQDRVKAYAYMETIVCPMDSQDWPEQARPIFQSMRSPAGEEMVLQKNVFVDRILPASVLRELTDEEMAVYRKRYTEPGESRRPTLTWPREIPLDGEPADVVAIAEEYSQWMAANSLPKLFINAKPGVILIGKQREFCRSWPNQAETTVKGSHFIQEDSPHEIGAAVAEFVKKNAG